METNRDSQGSTVRLGSAARVLVTGGASGIGAATVARLRGLGAEVTVWDRTPVAGDLSSYDVDVSDPTQVTAAMAVTGPVTHVVASAGIGRAHPLLEETLEDWNRVLAINVTGVWLTLQAAAQTMIDTGNGGSIVVVTSISGTLADRDMGAYCVSKAAADMLVRVAAVEWGAHGITVNAVGPGVTRTPMLPQPERLPGWVEGLAERTALGRLGEADDVAEAVVALLDLPWVTGQIVHADGGLALHSSIDAFGQLQRVKRGAN